MNEPELFGFQRSLPFLLIRRPHTFLRQPVAPIDNPIEYGKGWPYGVRQSEYQNQQP